MYGKEASIFYRNLGSDEWPRYYYPNQNTYALERYLLLEYVKTDLYEWQKRLGMLSPHVEPFILETEKLERKTEKQFTTDNKNDVSNEKENTKEKETQIRKLQETNSIQSQEYKDTVNSSQWKEYKNVKNKKKNIECKENKSTNNLYEVLPTYELDETESERRNSNK